MGTSPYRKIGVKQLNGVLLFADVLGKKNKKFWAESVSSTSERSLMFKTKLPNYGQM